MSVEYFTCTHCGNKHSSGYVCEEIAKIILEFCSQDPVLLEIYPSHEGETWDECLICTTLLENHIEVCRFYGHPVDRRTKVTLQNYLQRHHEKEKAPDPKTEGPGVGE